MVGIGECAEKVQFKFGSTGSGVWNLVRGIPYGDVRHVAGNAELKTQGYICRFRRLYCRGNY